MYDKCKLYHVYMDRSLRNITGLCVSYRGADSP